MTGETVTVLTGVASVDRYGNAILDWSTPTERQVAGCAVAPRSSSEDRDGRAGVIVGLSLYLPAGCRLTAQERVRVRGVDYEVDGEPGDWRDPFDGVAAGVEVALRVVHG